MVRGLEPMAYGARGKIQGLEFRFISPSAAAAALVRLIYTSDRPECALAHFARPACDPEPEPSRSSKL